MNTPTPLNLQSDYHFILNCFTPSDIEALISDMELHIDGFEFLYAIDTYDVVENYLPYTQNEVFSKIDKNFQAQKFICYDYFFGDLNQTTCILLDDYKIELFSAKNKLSKSLSNARVLIKNLEDLKKETGDFFHHPEKAETFFKNNLEVILLLLILNDKSNSILQEFYHFIRKRLHIVEIQVKNKSDKKAVEAIFDTSFSSKFSVDLFERYIDDNKKYLLNITDPSDREMFMKKTFRDIQAIERVMETNRQFNDKQLKYKTIYLSSAKKTNEIFKAIYSLPLLLDRKGLKAYYNVHRNIYQFFLFDRLKQEFRDDPANALVLLNDLKDLLSKLNTSSLIIKNDKDTSFQILQRVKKLFDEKSNILDNHFFYSVYEKYKNTFDNLSTDNNLYSLNKKEVLQIMQEVDKNKEIYRSRIFALEFALSQLNQTYDVVDAFWGAVNYEPEYRYGKDIVRNPYQHLPILLLIGEQFNSTLKEKLYLFLNLNAEIADSDQTTLKKYVRDIITELDRLNTGSVYNRCLRALIISYLNFVAQNKSKEATRALEDAYGNLEEKLILDLERQFTIFKYQFSKIDYEKAGINGKIEFIQEHKDVLTEIVYILLWLYRRNLREDEGIARALELNNTEIDDPRIDQGIGLAYVAKVYRAIKDRFTSDEARVKFDADMAIQYLKSAYKRYQLLINVNSKTETSFLVIKNFIAVLNSIADMSIRKFEMPGMKPDFSLIETARECINEVKSLFNTIELIYDDHPTYSATEIEIEYYEALEYYNSGLISTAHQKIVNASMRHNMIMKLPNSEKLIDELFIEKQSKINGLAHQIINYYPSKRHGK